VKLREAHVRGELGLTRFAELPGARPILPVTLGSFLVTRTLCAGVPFFERLAQIGIFGFEISSRDRRRPLQACGRPASGKIGQGTMAERR